MKELTVGQMAKLNCVSSKALRIYHDMGLLVPRRVDPETGYRYYSYDQCFAVDMIQQLGSMGLTLSQIKELVDSKDEAFLANYLKERSNALDEEMNRLRLARYNAHQMLASCASDEEPVEFDRIMLKRMPQRYALFLPVFDRILDRLDPDGLVHDMHWETNLRKTKRYFIDQGLPLELFHNLGSRIAKDDFLRSDFIIKDMFILIDDAELAEMYGAEIVPEGMYLMVYKNGQIAEDGSNNELHAVKQLLLHAEEQGLEIAGDYLGETAIDAPGLVFRQQEKLLRFQIPVRGL